MLLKTDNTIRMIPGGSETIKKIPNGNWLLLFDNNANQFYLEKQKDFLLPKKVYGNVYNEVNRYLNTFKNRDKNLGILLKGLKGTGKSLTAKSICINSDMPVILITQPFSGTLFHNFIASIEQECIIYIDEFEKIYLSNSDYPEEDAQKGLLTLFDGVFQSKKIFLLTANDHWSLNDALINRPGRIHYLKEYDSLSDDIIDEIIEDSLINKDYMDDLKRVINIIGEVSIDSLTSLINEINMYNERPSDAIKNLNIKAGAAHYEVTWEIAGVGTTKTLYKCVIDFNPLSRENFGIEGYYEEKRDWRRINLIDSKVDFEGKKILITNSGKITFTFTPTKKYKLTL